jgi:hypothetical protein
MLKHLRERLRLVYRIEVGPLDILDNGDAATIPVCQIAANLGGDLVVAIATAPWPSRASGRESGACRSPPRMFPLYGMFDAVERGCMRFLRCTESGLRGEWFRCDPPSDQQVV